MDVSRMLVLKKYRFLRQLIDFAADLLPAQQDNGETGAAQPRPDSITEFRDFIHVTGNLGGCDK